MTFHEISALRQRLNFVCHKMIRHLLIVLFTISLLSSSAQTMDKYADQLYFGMLSFTPDSTITDFLRKCVPAIFEERDSSGGWTMYPPGAFDEPKCFKVTHAYVFESHPYFDGHFKLGQLALTEKVYADEKWNGNITDVKLWFEFDNEEDAKRAFTQLVDTFSSFNVLKRVTYQQGIDKAEFTDSSSDKYYSHIEIILATDYSLGKRYLMPSENETRLSNEAGYRLLINVGNDLY